MGRYIAANLKPISTVESEAFKQLVQELDGRYKLPGRTYFSQTVLPELYQETKQSVIDCLQQAPVVALTTDGWTSRATQSYITVTAHVIDPDWKMHNFVLQTRMIAESHTGTNIAEVLNAAVEEWGVQRGTQPIPIVNDNAANMGTAVQESKLLSPHVGCFAHVLNLACHSALKVNTVSRLLGRVRIVAFFHRSTTAAALLVKKQKLLQLPEHKLIMDVATRWNSAYDMIERYLEQQAAVMAVLTQSDIRRNARDICTLNDDDITNLEELVTVLKPLSTVTALLCDACRPTISLVLPLKDRLLATLPPQAQDSALVSAVKLAIIGNLSGRYQAEDRQLYLWQASALDPCFKTLPTLPQDRRQMVYASLVGLASSDANKIQPTVTVKQEPGIPAATHVQPQPGTSAVVEAITPLLPTLPVVSLQTEGNGGSPPPKKKAAMKDIFGDIYVTKVEPATEVSIGVRAQQEVTKYTDHSQTPGIPLTEDPLLWWKSHQHEFPLLACVARRVLCVPGTSVPSECVFSTAGDVISAQRANLSPENADFPETQYACLNFELLIL